MTTLPLMRRRALTVRVENDAPWQFRWHTTVLSRDVAVTGTVTVAGHNDRAAPLAAYRRRSVRSQAELGRFALDCADSSSGPMGEQGFASKRFSAYSAACRVSLPAAVQAAVT